MRAGDAGILAETPVVNHPEHDQHEARVELDIDPLDTPDSERFHSDLDPRTRVCGMDSNEQPDTLPWSAPEAFGDAAGTFAQGRQVLLVRCGIRDVTLRVSIAMLPRKTSKAGYRPRCRIIADRSSDAHAIRSERSFHGPFLLGVRSL